MRLQLHCNHVSLGEVAVSRSSRANVETVAFTVTVSRALLPGDMTRTTVIHELMFTGCDAPGAPMRLRQFPGPYPVITTDMTREAITYHVRVTLPLSMGRRADPVEAIQPQVIRRPNSERAEALDVSTLGEIAVELPMLIREAYGEAFALPMDALDQIGGYASMVTVDPANDTIRIEKAPGEFVQFSMTRLVALLLDPDQPRVVGGSQPQKPGRRQRRRAVQGS